MQASQYSMGLMSTFEHARLANQLVRGEASDEAMRAHDDLPTTRLDLPTAHASDLSTPSTLVKAEASEHADISRNSNAGELSGLLQAHTISLT